MLGANRTDASWRSWIELHREWPVEKLLIGFGGGVLVVGVAMVVWRLARRKNRNRAPSTVSFQSFVTSMRAVGELSVFRIMTKEVITASDHWFGEFGRKYLNWLLSSQRITLVIEFDIDFRYDLTDPDFKVDMSDERHVCFVLPPCRHEVLIRNMHIHSEDKAELLPWLMPDLLGRFFTGGFSVEAKNKLIGETRTQASRFAGDLVQKVDVEATASARRTLTMLAQGLGAEQVDFEFQTAAEFRPRIDISRLEQPQKSTGIVMPGLAAPRLPAEDGGGDQP